jgi:hypothetical protein
MASRILSGIDDSLSQEDIVSSNLNCAQAEQGKTEIVVRESGSQENLEENTTSQPHSEIELSNNRQQEFRLTGIPKLILDVYNQMNSELMELMNFVFPLLKQGGKPVGLILALGVFAIFVARIINPWVAALLTAGAVAVAVIASLPASDI